MDSDLVSIFTNTSHLTVQQFLERWWNILNLMSKYTLINVRISGLWFCIKLIFNFMSNYTLLNIHVLWLLISCNLILLYISVFKIWISWVKRMRRSWRPSQSTEEFNSQHTLPSWQPTWSSCCSASWAMPTSSSPAWGTNCWRRPATFWLPT